MRAEPTALRVAETHPACRVLGPGTRFAVWVQGCPLRCRGCISPQWLAFDGGTVVPVAALAAAIAGTRGIEGITVSGGEPFAQAESVAELAGMVRSAGLSVMAYTGYRLPYLRRRGTPGQRRLLGLLDILVDGPYVDTLHADLRWRASSNQEVHFLTGRYAHLAGAPDGSAGLQVELSPDRGLEWLGVPPTPGFREGLARALAARSVALKEAGGE